MAYESKYVRGVKLLASLGTGVDVPAIAANPMTVLIAEVFMRPAIEVAADVLIRRLAVARGES